MSHIRRSSTIGCRLSEYYNQLAWFYFMFYRDVLLLLPTCSTDATHGAHVRDAPEINYAGGRLSGTSDGEQAAPR